MTYLDRALHALDWLFSKPVPDPAQFAVGMVLYAALCGLAVLIIKSVDDHRRKSNVPR